MAGVSGCPDPQELRQLLLGRHTEEAALRLERHVEQCRRCGRLLPGLAADDALVEAMRAPSTSLLQPSDLKTLRGLLPRLHQLRLPGSTRLPGRAEPGGSKAPLVSFDFLNPPQEPGEIGRLGPYRVLKLLGQGGMGVVFQAEDLGLRRTVALKVMRPDAARKASARERFLREARAAAKIQHDHIVTIYQVGEDRGIPFLAMQLLKGMTLEDFLAKKQLTTEQILKLGREIARGLAAAHEAGLIHRDIKPANIWLDSGAGGRVKILDFGLARAAEGDSRLTEAGTILGTPAYMAPEQARGDETDGRADLFSLGCILYRLCTGRTPWQANDTWTTLVAAATEEPAPLLGLNPTLPPGLADLVMRLLAKRPQDRPESARAVVESLHAIEREQPTVQLKFVPPLPASSPWQDLTEPRGRMRGQPVRRRWPLVLAACAGLAAVVLSAVLLSRHLDTPSPGPAKELPKTTRAGQGKSAVNSIGMKMVLIPAGKFLMGSSPRDVERIRKERFQGYLYPGWERSETPQHEVRISRGFFLGIHEVTQGQYLRVMGANPSANQGSPRHPVERVLWSEADAFCRKLSTLPEEVRAGRVYRLPTEAEWEYACRAGTTTLFHCGDTLSSGQANIDADHPFGTARKGPRPGKTVPVGSYPPNAWGLYDMHGNVWEWCLDGERRYTAAAVEDPTGPLGASGGHILRGGGWQSGACRCAFRKERPLVYRTTQAGFRVACFVGGRPDP